MLATVLTVWCVASFLLAPFVGRAIRASRRAEKLLVASQSLEAA
jgi:hypothetical protein